MDDSEKDCELEKVFVNCNELFAKDMAGERLFERSRGRRSSVRAQGGGLFGEEYMDSGCSML
jgi:hypothetical protein